MEEINIVYVDDDLDINISEYLNKRYKHQKFKVNYEELEFKIEGGYDNLINTKHINEANIILIDSKLFENDQVKTGKFTGEEFKIIFKKIFPFIEVIVITQNDLSDDYGTIPKYKASKNIKPLKYYDNQLKTKLDNSIRNIEIYRNIANKLKSNEEIDKLLIEKTLSSLDGYANYDELKSSDIDEIISIFKEMEKTIGEQ